MLDDELSPEEQRIRANVRKVLEEEIKPLVPAHFEASTFPSEIIPLLKKLNINGLCNSGYGAPGFSALMSGIITMELFRTDASVATFFLVHNCIGMDCIFHLGSQEQKDKYLPECMTYDKIVSFGLTEPEFGSDATSLQTSAKPVDGGYILNGHKRWIGNATHGNYVVTWARNTDTGKVQGFVVDTSSKGYTAEKIEGKYSMRAVQNAHITYKDVFVPEIGRLAKVDDFASGANQILKSS